MGSKWTEGMGRGENGTAERGDRDDTPPAIPRYAADKLLETSAGPKALNQRVIISHVQIIVTQNGHMTQQLTHCIFISWECTVFSNADGRELHYILTIDQDHFANG